MNDYLDRTDTSPEAGTETSSEVIENAAPADPELGEEYRTRPGTPMIGRYSINQMDDFYAALARGEVKPTGIMNYLQRLFIAQRCKAGDRVLDVCCGAGLQLPVLYRYQSDIDSYTGLDISPGNLAEARDRRVDLDREYGAQFKLDFHQMDVSEAWPAHLGQFDVAVYTSALEHLPRDLGVASLRHTAAALASHGRLYLSTPNSPGPPPRKLQHRVHVYEWSHDELVGALDELGLVVHEVIGILPPLTQRATEMAITTRFGADATSFYRRLRDTAPDALLGPVVATALDDAATEILYVCSRRAA
ncbi:MAG: class I SAM-dependent methyltransferase [Pseudonocardia sp.]